MTEMFGEAWSPMSVPDLAPDDDDDYPKPKKQKGNASLKVQHTFIYSIFCLDDVFQYEFFVVLLPLEFMFRNPQP